MTPAPNPNHPIARAIREAIADASVKQKDLAARIGVSENTVSGWTTGRYQPGTQHADALARQLGRSIDDFLDLPVTAAPQTAAPPQPRTGRDGQLEAAEQIVERLAAVDPAPTEEKVAEVATELNSILAAARVYVASKT